MDVMSIIAKECLKRRNAYKTEITRLENTNSCNFSIASTLDSTQTQLQHVTSNTQHINIPFTLQVI